MTKAAGVLKRESAKETALHDELASVYFSKKEPLKKITRNANTLKNRIPARALIYAASYIILAASLLVFLSMFYRQDTNILSNEVKKGA